MQSCSSIMATQSLRKACNGLSPLISIVMPSLNQRQFLEIAARSVLEQADVDVELIVMDPGSVDGSRELLHSLHQEFGNRLRLVLQKDQGQSDAVNTGMALAKGQIMGWLNSDDRLRPGSLGKVSRTLVAAQPAWLYGRAGVIDQAGRPASSYITLYKNTRGRRFSRFKLLQENFICQMAVFWNRSMWEQLGGLNLDKHLDMDYDLWLRFAERVAPITLAETLSDFRVHAAAKGSVHSDHQLKAALQTAKEHAASLGIRGQAALLVHRVLSHRTRLAYRLVKPK